MARNHIQKILEDLEDEFAGELLRDAANLIRKFQTTLISVAQCQNGIASHQAQEVLQETGHCYHFNQTYRAESVVRSDLGCASPVHGTWHCSDCGGESSEKLVPYQ